MALRPVKKTTTTTTGLDLNILSGVSLDPERALGLGLDRASTKAAGIAKAANLFYKILFTRKGSNPLDPLEGTHLLAVYDTGIDEVDAMYVAVQDAVSEALEQVQELQGRARITDIERLTQVTITSFEVDQVALALNFGVNLYTAAGEKVAFEIPSIVLS